MGFPKSLEAYAHLSSLLNQILEGGQEVEIVCANPKDANRQRFEIYNFRRLLRQEYKGSKYDSLQFVIEPARPHIIWVRNAPKVDVRPIEGTTLCPAPFDPLELELREEANELARSEAFSRPNVEALMRKEGISEEEIAAYFERNKS